MDVKDLDLPQEAIEALNEQGYITLHPPQEKGIPIALEGRNLVVAVPTASGKSLIGYAGALKTILEKGKKVLYIVPLKALAAEKKSDMDKFSHLGFKTAMSTGDLDSEDRWMNEADFIVATSEKADSLIRHGSTVIEDVGLVIADEIHLLHDPGRGPTLEVALTKLKRMKSDMQFIALSATITNARDLAMWLDAELVKMDWRPIPLHEGVYYEGAINFEGGRRVGVEDAGDEVWSLVEQTVKDGGQCIVFVNARRSTEALAVNFSPAMAKYAGKELRQEELATLEGEDDSTAMGRKLSSCVKCGMAFHNAGLTFRQRRYVEENFKNGNIKCIVATPTLAAGINLPARRVIVRDTKRFEANAGSTPISVMEIKQMCGRAGRPGYDTFGEAVLIAKNERDLRNLTENYIGCESETIMSKLGNETVLRNHILGLIATGSASSSDDIVGFIRDTFYGSESELFGIESAVENVVDFLEEEGMAERDGESIGALPFGKRVSDLYIDPKSAVILKKAVDAMDDDTEAFPVLHAVASTPDVLSLYPRKSDDKKLNAAIAEWDKKLLIDIPDSEDYSYEFFLGDLKTALLISDWIEETDEETITESYGVGPGDIRSRVDMMDWLIYAMCEIAVLFKPEVVKKLRKILVRVRYGIRQELTEIVTFRGVGRTRARVLYDRGIKTRKDVARIEIGELAAIPKIGPALAKRMKEDAGAANKEETFRPTPIDDEETAASEKPKQSKLLDF